jgi:hypothetical protein
MLARSLVSLAIFLVPVSLLAVAPPAERPGDKTRRIEKKIREVAGSAEYLRSVPKRFATLKTVDARRRRVTLLIEGESLAKVWPMLADAEVKVAGWWGRLEQFTPGDRVWVWFRTDRKNQPVSIAMLADELSLQDIHGTGVALKKLEGNKITVKPEEGPLRTLPVAGGQIYRAGKKASLADFPIDSRVYFQSNAGRVRLLLDPPGFEARRLQQKTALRKRWVDEGLPGSVVFLHPFSGEMEFMLDHEAMRWGRSLKLGDKVSLQADPPIPAVVKLVRPWRERTQVRLVARALDLTDLHLGQRTHLRMTPPAPEVETATLPPDIDQPRSRAERIDWFLASIYCTCGVRGDTCTGHFYTLSSCNPNGCGMPNAMRKEIAGLIDKGLTNRQIFERLLKSHGPGLLQPHLLP